MSLGTVREPDRHLDDAEALAQRSIRRLDLEGVALRMDLVEVDRLQHLPPVALEAAGEVADADAEQEARVERAAPRDDAPAESPVLGAAAVDVAGAEREVGAGLARGQQPRYVLRGVGEIAVHLEDVARAFGER